MNIFFFVCEREKKFSHSLIWDAPEGEPNWMKGRHSGADFLIVHLISLHPSYKEGQWISLLTC